MFKGLFEGIFGLDELYLKDSFTGTLSGPYRGTVGNTSNGNLQHNVYVPDPFDSNSFRGPFSGTIESGSTDIITGFIVICLCWIIITVWLPVQALRWTSHFIYSQKHNLRTRAVQYGFLAAVAWSLSFGNVYLIGEVSGFNYTHIHYPLLVSRTYKMEAELPSQITMNATLPSCNPSDQSCFDGNLRVVIKNESRRTLNIIGSWNFIPIGKIWDMPRYENQCLFIFEENWAPNIVKPGESINLGCELNPQTLDLVRTNGFTIPIFGTLVLTDTRTNTDIALKLPIVLNK